MAEPTKEELIARVGAFEKQLGEKKNGELEFKVWGYATDGLLPNRLLLAVVPP